MKQFDSIVQLLVLFLIVLNTVLYSWSYLFKKKQVALLLFSLYLFACSATMILVEIIANKGENNLYLSHIYFISQFIFLSFFYKELFHKKQKKWVYFTLLLILAFLSIQYINNPELIYKFNILEIFITSFPIVIYSIIHLYNSLSKKGNYMLINSGVLIYLTTSTLIFILGDYLSNSNYKGINAITRIWMLNKVLYFVYLILILLEWKKSFYQVKKK